jgi:hypothetical protein
MNVYIMFKLSFWVIKTSQLLLYSEIIGACSEIHIKHVNTLCGQNVDFGYDKPGGTFFFIMFVPCFSNNKIPLLKSNQCTCCVNPN